MRVAVFGAGGVGAYFGARLAEAGTELAVIARGAHLEAIRADGLRVDSVLGDMRVEPAITSASTADVGPVDVVLLGVKTWQVAEAMQSLGPLLGRDTLVVPLQNGVETIDELTSALGAQSRRGRCLRRILLHRRAGARAPHRRHHLHQVRRARRP